MIRVKLKKEIISIFYKMYQCSDEESIRELYRDTDEILCSGKLL